MADFTRNLAFVIGINNYGNGIPQLQTAVNDAKKLVEILREKHGYQVWVCLDETATLKNLNDFLTIKLPQQVQADDRLLFYFAGHGVALNGSDGPEGYLIPQDAKLGDVQSYLPMTKLQEALSQLPCRHFLGIFDCCFAGAFRWSSNRDLLATPEVIHKERYERLICDPAWQVITSSDYDQKASDAFVLRSHGQEGDHSPFAAALLDAFAGDADSNPPAADNQPAGDGITTATELYLYLRDRVELATEGNSQRQTPGIWPLKKHDKGEYIFLTPGHELNLPPAPPLDKSKNPYRGLESFEEKHSQFFFGRDSLEDKLLDVVTNNPLTLVLGASGSGKSSLVKAGLIPKIRNLKNWYVIPPIRPGDKPFRSLNFALVNSKFPEVDQLDKKTLADRITEWISSNCDTNLLLVIDQSEEIITQCHDDEERERFFSELAQAIATHPQQLRVVLTIRSDFEPQLRDSILQSLPNTLQIRNTIIKNHWQAARFIVPAMTRLQLRDAIEKPAELRVMHFDPHTLVDHLIDEVADMPGALPLLSFALSELYLKYLQRQQTASNNGDSIDRAITQKDYDQMGGVAQSLTQRSDSEYDLLIKKNPVYSQIIRHVMLRMVAVGGGELAIRQVPLSELKYTSGKQELVEKVLERFSQARLLVQGQDAVGNTYVELAHSILVRGWLKLRNWLQEEKNLRLQRRLTPAAMEWNSHKKVAFLWHGDPYINVLHRDVLNSTDNNWLNQVESEFVQKSVQRKLNIIRSRWGISLAVILGSIGLASWALFSQRQSQFGEINAKISYSEALFNTNQELDALLNSLSAGKKFQQRLFSRFSSDTTIQNAVLQNLRKTFYAVKESSRSEIQAEWGSVRGIFFGKDNQLMFATAQNNGVASLRNFVGSELTKFTGHKGFAKFAASPDGSVFATNDEGTPTSAGTGNIYLWSQNQKIREFTADKKYIEIIRFNEDGQEIATLSEDEKKNNVARLWNLQGEKLAEFSLPNAIQDLAFHPNKQMLIAIDAGKHLRFFDLLGKELEVPQEFKKIDGIQQIKFGPNGMMATKSVSTVSLWRLDGEKVENFLEIKLPQGEIVKMVFSHDGKQLATYGSDSILRLWNLASPPLIATEFPPKELKSLSFSQNNQIAAVTNSGIVRLLDIQGNQLKEFKVPGKVIGGSFSSTSQQIATIYSDGIVRLLDLQGSIEFKAHSTKVYNVNFSPDGQKIATIGDNDQKQIIVRLKDLKSQKVRDFTPILNHQVKNTYFQPNGNLKVVTIKAGSKGLFLWDFLGTNGMPLLKPEDSVFDVIAFTQNGKLFATATDKIVKLWDFRGRELLRFSGHERAITNLSFSSDSSILAVIGQDGTAKFWHFAELEQLLSRGCDRLSNYPSNNPDLQNKISQICTN